MSPGENVSAPVSETRAQESGTALQVESGL
jgi:hypothetical protein